MYELLGRSDSPFPPEALRRAHRFSGHLFIALFVLISGLCLLGIIRDPFELSPRGILHSVIALAIFTLLAIKLFTVKFYRIFLPEVSVLGKSVFTLTLVLFFISAAIFF
jgi:hypothetical protein